MMKCETNAQLHDALTALIDGADGTMRDALTAIVEYTDAELSPVPFDLEANRAEIEAAIKRGRYIDQCCCQCQDHDTCGTLNERIKELQAIEASGGDVTLAKLGRQKNEMRK
jgi:uncharacterized protein (DUF169 family)